MNPLIRWSCAAWRECSATNTGRYEGTLEATNRMRGTMASAVQTGTFTAVRK